MRAIGIILAGGNSSRMGELSAKRAVAAMPVTGSYRAIDFSLSNMTNSHIQKVAVFTQYNSRSLNEHLNSSKWWDFGRKQGGLYVFTPTITTTNSYWYQGTADALYQNISFLKESHEPYVVIASGDGVYKLDYSKVLEQHIEKGADITIVTTDINPEDDDVSRFGVVKTNDDMQVIDFEEKPLVAQTQTASIGVYVIRRRQLIELLEACAKEGRTDFVKDILIRYKSVKKIYAYKMDSYWRNIGTIDSYYRTNMDFLKKDIRDYFFRQYPLVDNGVLVESVLKGKSLRRALCERHGQVFMAMTTERESMHDFAQALVDIGVTNAVYLVGGTIYGWAVDREGERHEWGTWSTHVPQNITYIVWRRNQ